MKIIIVLEDIIPDTNNGHSNIDIKVMKQARTDEPDDALTPAVALQYYLQLAIKHYLNGTGRLTWSDSPINVRPGQLH